MRPITIFLVFNSFLGLGAELIREVFEGQWGLAVGSEEYLYFQAVLFEQLGLVAFRRP